MQLRYLGDSHDYIKFALLRHLHDALKVRIGINWYLTDPGDVDRPNNQDGEQRHHLNRDEWRGWKSDLFEKIKSFQEPDFRSFEYLRSSEILPTGTLTFETQLTTTHHRSNWHKDAVRTLAHADLIFLDPDNGFEVPSWTRRTRPKYATYDEAYDYYNAGKIVIGIQFARQCNPVKRGRYIRSQLLACIGAATELPILRGRVSPNILFFTVCPLSCVKEVENALTLFAAQSPTFNVNEKRIQLIT